MNVARGAAAALVAAVLVSGCSDDDPEPNLPDPTPSASTSAASGSTSPTAATSAATQKLDPNETVAAWVAARNRALEDGDTGEVRALSAATCATCEEHIRPIEEVFAAGGSFRTPGWSVDKSKVTKQSATQAQVDVAMTMAAGETVPEEGATPTTYPEDQRLMFFKMSRRGGAWHVSLIGYYS